MQLYASECVVCVYVVSTIVNLSSSLDSFDPAKIPRAPQPLSQTEKYGISLAIKFAANHETLFSFFYNETSPRLDCKCIY